MKNIKDSNRKKRKHSRRGKLFIQKIFALGNILDMGYKDLEIKLQM